MMKQQKTPRLPTKRKVHLKENTKSYNYGCIATGVSALSASFLVANRVAKAKKPFTIGDELILLAAKDICCALLGEAAVLPF